MITASRSYARDGNAVANSVKMQRFAIFDRVGTYKFAQILVGSKTPFQPSMLVSWFLGTVPASRGYALNRLGKSGVGGTKIAHFAVFHMDGILTRQPLKVAGSPHCAYIPRPPVIPEWPVPSPPDSPRQPARPPVNPAGTAAAVGERYRACISRQNRNSRFVRRPFALRFFCHQPQTPQSDVAFSDFRVLVSKSRPPTRVPPWRNSPPLCHHISPGYRREYYAI